jgi:hypothetical protein
LIGDSTLDEALEMFRLDEISSLLRIEIEVIDGDTDFASAGWSFVGDEDSHFTLVYDLW